MKLEKTLTERLRNNSFVLYKSKGSKNISGKKLASASALGQNLQIGWDIVLNTRKSNRKTVKISRKI